MSTQDKQPEAPLVPAGAFKVPAAATVPAKRPPAHWSFLGGARWPDNRPIPHTAVYCYGRLVVISQLADMEAPDGSHDVIPQWLITVTRRKSNGDPARADADDVARVLRAFDMEGAEEDNHCPGFSRGFFLPVDPTRRVACECKATEVTVVEPDGYTWQNATDPAECRRCAFAAISGMKCPDHQGAA